MVIIIIRVLYKGCFILFMCCTVVAICQFLFMRHGPAEIGVEPWAAILKCDEVNVRIHINRSEREE